MPPAIATHELIHRFPSPRGPVEALRGVTLTIGTGEFFGLFGPNGAGKTTLIRILSTLVIPVGGTARVLGFDVVRHAAQVRACIGLVFSNENSFYGRLTGRQNLEFFAALQNLPAPAARRRTAELLDLFGLTGAAEKPVQSYSTGMRQKLNVARALLHNPPILFLDEPTKGMDVLTAEALRTLLREELVGRHGKTVLLTTHDLQEMEQLCDRVGILEQGRIRAVGVPADLIREASPSVVFRLELVGAVNGLADRLARLPSVRSVEVVSQTPASTVLDLILNDAPAPGGDVWSALAAQNAHVKRLGPREDGLATVLKQMIDER
jgi:ABC-2 type transport system ATP-binding protein